METATRTAAPSPAAPITTLLHAISVPAIGTHWVEQGGIFAGIVRDTDIEWQSLGMDGPPECALIIAIDPRGQFEDREWGEYGKDVQTSADNGFANTVAMAEAGSKLAQDVRALDIAGLTDWYLPSQADLHIAFANAREHFEKADWYWTSTQHSPRYAWVQDFELGDSGIRSKGYEFRAVAVRRFVL